MGLIFGDPNTAQRLSAALLGLGSGMLTGNTWGQGLGRGFAQANAGLQDANDSIRRDKLLGFQEQDRADAETARKAQADAEAAQQARIDAYIATLPPEQQAMARLAPKEVIAEQVKQMYPGEMKAPTTRTIPRGSSEVTQEWDAKSGVWKDICGGPRWAPPTQINMPKPLPSLDERDDLVLRSGDPNSMEYGQAYYRQYMTPRMVQTENGMVPVMPAIPPGIRKPGVGGGAALAAGGATPGPSADVGGGFGIGSPIPGTKPAEKPPTGDQAQAAGFASRMRAAEPILDKIAGQGVDSSSFWGGLKAKIPGGNYMQDPQYQQYMQAAQDWVRAKLRKESGAVIGPQEMAHEIATYFPQPGDDPKVIADKRAARELDKLFRRVAAEGRARFFNVENLEAWLRDRKAGRS